MHILIAICVIFIIIGCFGNIISIVIFSHKELKVHSTSVYLRCSSFVNLLSIIYLPFMSMPSIWPINTISCKIFLALMMLLIELQSWLLTFSSLDRLVSVMKPYKFKFKNKIRFQLGIIIGVSIAIFCLIFPYLYFYEKVYLKETNQTLCLLPSKLKWIQAYATIEYVLIRVLIPFSLMLISSLIIVLKVSKNKRLLNTYNPKFRIEYRMTKVFLFTDTFFLIFRMPMVIYTLFEYDEGKLFYQFAFSICVLLGSVHNVFVFAVFLFFNRVYRSLFLRYLNHVKKIISNCLPYYIFKNSDKTKVSSQKF